MSFVTFVRDYIQDPDKIIHIPNFIFDACKEFFWYIFSFQWFRNLTYVTLYKPSDSQSSTLLIPKLYNLSKTFIFPDSIENNGAEGTVNYLSQSTNKIESDLNAVGSWLSTYFECQPEQLSFFQNYLYGFFNGISSSFHFCAVTILIIHILLNENKNRAFNIALISCFGDISYMVAVLFGFREIVISWLALEPLGYILGFGIQFFFALEIIKDNRRIKASYSDEKVRHYSGYSITREADTEPQETDSWLSKLVKPGRTKPVNLSQGGQLSFNRWLVPLLILFSWCEQTQFFQTGGVFGLQPTATLLQVPGLGLNLEIGVYLLAFFVTRILVTWFCLSIFQILINWLAKILTKDLYNNLFHASPSVYLQPQLNRQKVITFINLLISLTKKTKFNKFKNNFFASLFALLIRIYNDFVCKAGLITNFLISLVLGKSGTGAFKRVKSWFIPKSLQRVASKEFGSMPTGSFSEFQKNDLKGLASSPTVAAPEQIRYEVAPVMPLEKQKLSILRDPLAIAAVTCSLAFLPAYSSNLLITKPIGFFPEENRIKHSLFSPWDMPATVLASDMDFISNHPNLAEYPFFLPFYDKGDYGGWLGVGEEDIRYGPFRLWQSRRIRAPWRRTTLQEPVLTFANDKSLFINPLHRTPDLKSSAFPFLGVEPLGYEIEKETLTSFTSSKKDSFANSSNTLAIPFSDSNQEAHSLESYLPTYSLGPTKQRDSFVSKRAIPTGKAKQDQTMENSLSNNRRLKEDSLKSTANIKAGTFIAPSMTDHNRGSFILGRSKSEGKKETPSQKGFTKITFEGRGTLLWKDLFLQLKTKSAYAKLLAINYIKPFKTNKHLSTTGLAELSKVKQNRFVNGISVNKENEVARYNSFDSGLPLTLSQMLALVKSPKDLRDLKFVNRINKQEEQTSIKSKNPKITKAGRKKLIEVLKKPLRKVKTSSFFLSTIDQATQIKNNKQIRKRFKKFKKKLRLFRTRAYKKRNTKIKRLKHFHYIKNKTKKRRKSRRLIYKLRRQYPYIRNIKERKADIFGLYSPINLSWNERQINAENQKTAYFVKAFQNLTRFGFEKPPLFFKTREKLATDKKVDSKNKTNKINFQENPLYFTEYPKKKDFKNVKKDFNLIFRTQIGERLDFAQEEIRARIFMNPYIRFLLNNRIDSFTNSSRSTKKTLPKNSLRQSSSQTRLRKIPFEAKYAEQEQDFSTSRTFDSSAIGSYFEMAKPKPLKLNVSEAAPTPNEVGYELGKGLNRLASPSSIMPSKELSKRRLIISKYADALGFLKPSPEHSYVDRVYNHQFKGSLSTVRRLFSLKVQYDQPLVHPLNYKSVIEHEGLLIKNSLPDEVSFASDDSKIDPSSNGSPTQSYQRSTVDNSPSTGIATEGKLSNGSRPVPSVIYNGKPKILKDKNLLNLPFLTQNNKGINSNLLEKSYSAPLYASWDPNLRKLILTNRYLNYKAVTTLASPTHFLVDSMLSLKNQKFFDALLLRPTKLPSLMKLKNGKSKIYPKNEKEKPKNLPTQSYKKDGIAKENPVMPSKDLALLDLYQGRSKQLNALDQIKEIKGRRSKNNNLIHFTNWPLKEPYFKDNEFLISQLYSNSQPIDSLLSQENEKARPVALPRRVNSFNTVLDFKNNIPPTDAQRSQQFLKLESNDKKTFLFKHFWNSSNTSFATSGLRKPKITQFGKTEPLLGDSFFNSSNIGHAIKRDRESSPAKNTYSFTALINVPTSAEQRKVNRIEEREYPLWMVLKTLSPNQGGFLWPGD